MFYTKGKPSAKFKLRTKAKVTQFISCGFGTSGKEIASKQTHTFYGNQILTTLGKEKTAWTNRTAGKTNQNYIGS